MALAYLLMNLFLLLMNVFIVVSIVSLLNLCIYTWIYERDYIEYEDDEDD